MVAASVKVPTTVHVHAHGHPSFHIFGHEFISDLPIPVFILAIIGGFYLLSYTVSYIRLLLELTVIPGTSIKTFKSKAAPTYAIVTGATAGIGLEFAKQLAKAGYNLVLVSRSNDSLNSAATEITTKYKADVKTVALDFGKMDGDQEKGYKALEDILKEVDVGILINNVGVSHYMPVPFAETESAEMEAIINVNVTGTLRVTRLVLPHLLTRQTSNARAKSLILNIGTFGARVPSPLLATYSGSKAFLTTWSKALGTEVAQQGVIVRLILPAFVVSAMSKIRRSSALVPKPEGFVRATLGSIGLSRGASGRIFESTPYWSHALLDWGIGLLASYGEGIATAYNFWLHKDIRRRALAKKARAEKAK